MRFFEATQTARSTSRQYESGRQLSRRLNGLGPKQWNVQADQDLLDGSLQYFKEVCSEWGLDVFSSHFSRMARHICDICDNEGMKQKSMMTSQLFTPLAHVLKHGLRQLGDGLQQYLTSGQLPAHLTVPFLHSIGDLCLSMREMCFTSSEKERTSLATQVQTAGVCRP
jgi:hypothetical protein